jgi:hypothetical protein
MEPGNTNKPPFPIIMFFFALCTCAVDLFCAIISFIPVVGIILGGFISFVNNMIFSGTFFVWKLIGNHPTGKLSMGNYASRAAFNWILGLVPIINLFEAPLTVWRTWKAECAKAQKRQGAAQGETAAYMAAAANFKAYSSMTARKGMAA